MDYLRKHWVEILLLTATYSGSLGFLMGYFVAKHWG